MVCNKCNLEKENKFYIGKFTMTICMDCRNEYQKEWRDNNQRRVFELNLKHYYNLTFDDYSKLVINQNGRCAICERIMRLDIDHCHKTKKVRGLLCRRCNGFIGLIKDNPEKLIKYLGGSNGQTRRDC